MTNPASTSIDLKRRVTSFLARERARDCALNSLLDSLCASNDVYIFGGLLRDIALEGITSKKSDIDLVFLRSTPFLEKSLNGYGAVVNKFGGFRLNTQHWQVDIWKASNTWAFTQGHRVYEDVRSLLNTTITNWDSVLFDLKKNSLITKPHYFEDINNGYIDLVLASNPNKLGMCVRLLRTVSDTRAQLLSRSVSIAIHDLLAEFGIDQVLAYEKAHYKSSRIDHEVIIELDSYYAHNEPDLLPFKIPHIPRNLALFAN